MSLPNFKIPLFDVDWTLLKGGSVGNRIHHEAFDYALCTIYKKPTASINEIIAEGSIDTRILIDILKLHGVSEKDSKSKMPQALKVMKKYFKTNADKGSFKPMPGVIELLSTLKSKGIPLGLLTGNVEEIAWEKLRRAGIKDYFSFGAFGSMAYKRVDLIAIAKKQANKILRQNIRSNKLVIVGDTPLDIACARAGGIDVIAVGAGYYKTHSLKEADLVVKSLKEKDRILEFLNLS